MRLVTAGSAKNIPVPLVGRISRSDLPSNRRSEGFRLFNEGERPVGSLSGYKAILSFEPMDFDGPVVDRLREVDHLHDGDIVAVEGASGFVRSLYRPREQHHHIFVTERCSSNCLMCSQPPKDRDDIEALSDRNRQLIEFIKPGPPYLTITGGEPTLLGDHLFHLISQLKDSLPDTELHMLTNGRTFAWSAYAVKFAQLQHPNISLGIPLYSDCATEHDYVVQARNAFDQTVTGLHQAARNGIRTEIRVVLHRLTIPRLVKLAEYIYRNFPFVEHVALMGLEHTGYTPRNIEKLWIDPFNYQDELEAAVELLAMRGMNVSIYNHQLCILRQSLWPFARKSISDWKNLYLPACEGCSALVDCGGVFQWVATKHSAHLHTL